MIDLRTLSDDDLHDLRTQVLVEEERRQALATIPATIADLTAKFLEGGGNPNDLP